MDKSNNITMRDYIDTRFDAVILNASQRFDAQQLALKDALMAQEKQTALALINTEKAIDKADINTDKRFGALSEQIGALAETLNKNTGAQGIYVTHSDLAIVVDKIQTSFETALKPLVSQVNNLTAAQNSQQGKSSGLNAGWGYLIAGVSLIGMIISIFVA